MAGIVIVGLLATSVHLVGPQQEGVVKTLGNYTRNMEPGLNFSLPFPIETVDIEDVEGCLLYTSPSPRDVEESRMPSSA